MDPTWLVLLSVALGLVVGAGFVIVLVMATRRGVEAATAVTQGVPDGVDQVIDALDSVGIVVDPSNNVVKASAKAYTMGLVSHDVLAHPALVVLVDRVRRTGDSLTEELELARGRFGDANFHMILRVARLGSRYVLVIADDRTETYRLEAVRRDFVANISHELKTPIGAVGLLAEALDSAADDEQQVRRFATRLSLEATRLAKITQDIIELSRLQSVDTLEGAEPVSLSRVANAAADQNRTVAETRGIEIVVRADARAEVDGIEALLVTAVHNLISNAIQYSPDGSRVGVGVRIVDDVIEVAVTDQGEGIPEEDQVRIFERFFRVDQARARNTGGTGLGLAIVKHAVQNHGGDVRVWSHPGKGSTFTIRLPQASQTSGVRAARGEAS